MMMQTSSACWAALCWMRAVTGTAGAVYGQALVPAEDAAVTVLPLLRAVCLAGRV